MKRWLATWLTAITTAAISFMILPISNVTADQAPAAGPCALTIEMRYGGAAIQGLTITVYQAAVAADAGAADRYTLTGAFGASGVDLSGISSAAQNLAQAANLLNYAKSRGVPGINASTDGGGAARFTELPAGLYLVSFGPAAGFYNIAPYLIELPQTNGDGTYNYNVTASPKTEPVPVPPGPPGGGYGTYIPGGPGSTTAVTPPSGRPPAGRPPASDTPGAANPQETVPSAPPPGSDEAAIPDRPIPRGPATAGGGQEAVIVDAPPPKATATLPQTGMLNWPVPVMSVSGLMLFSAGLIMRKSNRDSARGGKNN